MSTEILQSFTSLHHVALDNQTIHTEELQKQYTI